MKLATIATDRAKAPSARFDIVTPLRGCRVTQKHRAVVTLLDQAYAGMRFAFASTWTDLGWRDAFIRGATGRIVTEQPREWILGRMQRAGSAWRDEANRLRASKLRRTHFVSQPLYFTARYGPAAWDFLQVRVRLTHEAAAPSVLPEAWLCDKPEDAGGWVSCDERAPALGPPWYELDEVVDVCAFVEERAARWRAEFVERLPMVADKRVTTIFVGENRRIEHRLGDLPDFPRTPGRWRLQRLFDDWAASSAGGSGENIERHWVIQDNEIPRWVNDPRLPSLVKTPARTDADLLGRLASFDRKAGYPFAWYFYMLHGNKIRSAHGDWAWKLVGSGWLRLPDQDVEVFRRWAERPYGF